jgi:hypothetical protein
MRFLPSTLSPALLFAVIATGATRADAQSNEPPPPDPWAVRPVALELQLGVGAPLGYAGLAVDWSPFPFISLNAGVGLNDEGVQFAGSGRIRPFRFGHTVRVAPYVGGGISAGPYAQRQTNIFDGYFWAVQDRWDMAIWEYLETGVDIRFQPEFYMRPTIGYEGIVNQGDAKQVDGPQSGDLRPSLVYTYLAFGYAF